ncbi:Transcription-repair coupling factor [hydrothermal vent metagenome]|uniref:Transcription-repair coupling factor n=1 Tax=hydrothermal vent metagenome TaxID=652676 RepID=A0A3B1E066_9ZZZZ
MKQLSRKKISVLHDLVPLMHRANGFDEVVAALQSGNGATIDGAWGSSRALAIAALVKEARSTLLIVLPNIGDVDDFAIDLQGFLNEPLAVFPAWESLPQEHDVADSIFGSRLRLLRELHSDNPPTVIVTSIAALLQPVPSQSEREAATRNMTVGEELDVDSFSRWLVEHLFEHVPAVEMPGEFSFHGGILDIFPPDAIHPVRIELFGDEIDSIRRFDVQTQRKIESLNDASFTLVTPVETGSIQEEEPINASTIDLSGEHFLDELPEGSWVVLTELESLVEEGKHYLERLDHPRGFYSVQSTLARCTKRPNVLVAAIAADGYDQNCHLQIESIERFSGPRSDVLLELEEATTDNETVLIVCHNSGEQERLQELFAETDLSIAKQVLFCVGQLTSGFRLVTEQLVVLSDHELFGRTEIRRDSTSKKLETRAIDHFLELREGELVVHLTHGIGRFRGMELLEKDSQIEEHLIIEFRDSVRVFVPASLIHLVQKYVGAARSVAKLSKVGSNRWAKQKQKVTSAIQDLASEMLRMQAMREGRPGLSCPPDSHWQQEFETAFPYTETKDQLTAIADVKADMQRNRPMDRLICGDVGYGKTEVAMRAAFKAIDAGRQVAILVPTTVLAEQHFRTFSERMAEFPITIDILSRFRTKKEQQKTLACMKDGTVDLVIGTHRLVQKDIKFKELGLLVIDEEQRFGVAAKDLLKQMRLEVDILTLSATPIPRTLHLSLLGIRDISNLITAPNERQPIKTRISRFDTELIRNAIVRELNRNGQIYFVHNRVHNIKSIADKIRTIVPEATVGIVHGQMNGGDLEQAMYEFVTHQTDILVATTIIESGLDIPTANTMFIHQADIYGLADLHQLRGRVGRYKHRAYCYLLLEEGKTVTATGAKRLKAIEEFSELGAGFKIAMRDLEIRGAGNILGTEQSGHISTVGYELYCQLLENSVRQLKKMPLRQPPHVAIDLPVSAYLPASYVPPGRQKIEVYRKLSVAKTEEELEQLREEFRDRFGTLPEETERLLVLKKLQLLALHWQIDDVHLEKGYAMFGYRNPLLIQQLSNARGSQFRVIDDKTACWVLTLQTETTDGLLAEMKSVLQPL